MLSEVLRLNDQLGEQFGGEAVEEEQVLVEMIALRAASYEERRARYLSDRIIDQRSWYGRKATANKHMARVWLCVGAAVYVIAIASVLLRIAIPSWKFWPTEPLL